MKFCSHCGAQIEDDAVICVKCGCQVTSSNAPLIDRPSVGFAILSFFFPLIGLILYLVWHMDSPLRAKSCGKGALIGFLTPLVVVLCVVAISCVSCIGGLPSVN